MCNVKKNSHCHYAEFPVCIPVCKLHVLIKVSTESCRLHKLREKLLLSKNFITEAWKEENIQTW